MLQYANYCPRFIDLTKAVAFINIHFLSSEDSTKVEIAKNCTTGKKNNRKTHFGIYY